MNLQNRVEKLERDAGQGPDGRVTFRVIVPPKMTREEWERRCRESAQRGEPFFTVRLNSAEDESDGLRR